MDLREDLERYKKSIETYKSWPDSQDRDQTIAYLQGKIDAILQILAEIEQDEAEQNTAWFILLLVLCAALVIGAVSNFFYPQFWSI